MPLTPNLDIDIPDNNGDADTWGTLLIAAWNFIDGYAFQLRQDVNAIDLSLYARKASPAFTGTASFANISASGTITGALVGNASSATTATRLTTARTIGLSGPVTATGVAFDGSGNISLATSVADGSLSIAKTSGLLAALDGKEPTLAAERKRVITLGTADPGTLAVGEIYLKHEA